MKDGGGAYSFSLGEAPLIQSYRLHRTAANIAVIGCLVTVALLFIGMFIFFKERRYFLWYALLSLMIALRGLFTGDKPIMEILPELNWTFAIRTEYISLILIVVFAVLYFRKLYRDTIPNFIFYPVLGVSALYGILAAVTKPSFFSGFNPYYAICWIAAGLWLLARLAMRIKQGGMERLFVFTGLLCFILTGVNDTIQYTFPVFMQFEDTVTIGMLLFVFMNMVALFFGFAKTEAALYGANQKAKEEAAKTTFYRQMSHALRTPLTKISTNIQTARRRPEESAELLTRSQDEIMKMAEIISDALKDGETGAGE
jgi:signal transduction histidine kinase